jgi:hypothetical protein
METPEGDEISVVEGGDQPTQDEEKEEKQQNLIRTTQFALLMFVTHGVWTFREGSTTAPASPSLSGFSSSPIARAHELEFTGLRLVHVVQKVDDAFSRYAINAV